jgi:shikimate dehydrogenase
VLGAGGAARAIILALAESGASEVLIVNRTPVRAFRAASLAPGVARVARAEECYDVDLIVQATPAGMGVPPAPAREGEEGTTPSDAWPLGVDPTQLSAGQIAVDLVYHPEETAWLAAAAAAGATARNGLGLLVHQAALQVERWTGRTPPLVAMWAAVSLPA